MLTFLRIWDKLYLMKKQISVEEKVYSYIQKHHMLEKDDKVIIGVSGGADSVCLLFVLLEYAGKVPLSLAVVHVNHGIRQDAAQDAQYVEKLCRSRGLPFYLVNADAPKRSRNMQMFGGGSGAPYPLPCI